MASLRDRLFDLVRSIPPGKVASYGSLAKTLVPHVPPVLVGKWMAQSPEGVPWWRVIGADGSLPIAKRDPVLAEIQIQKLVSERVEVQDMKVSIKDFEYLFD